MLGPRDQGLSLTSLHQRLFKAGGRLIRAARYFPLAEGLLTWSLFRQTLERIERLAWHPTWSRPAHGARP